MNLSQNDLERFKKGVQNLENATAETYWRGKASSKIIGIDLGTSNSSSAVIINGKPIMIPGIEGTRFPSYIAFTKDGKRLVGESARRQAVTNPEGTVQGIKRKMGELYKIHINGNDYTPEQLSAFILKKIKTDAEEFLGERVEKAVIAVPNYLGYGQRQAIRDAGYIAGLDVVRIIDSTVATSLAYSFYKEVDTQKLLIVDFGGGTLDVNVMEFGDGIFEVRSTSGDTQLGGIDMDKVILDYLVDTFVQRTSIDLRNDSQAMQRLREGAEKAKIELSTVLSTDINVPFIAQDSTNNSIDFETTLTRSKLDKLISMVLKKCETPIKQAIEDSKLSVSDIDKVILVGGPTRMPSVQEFVKKITGKSVEIDVESMEYVAVGAAIQGAVLAGETDDILVLGVTSRSLGVEDQGGICDRIIERNTSIPVKKSQVYSTSKDNQTSVKIHVVQGESEYASDNESIERFVLDGIPPAPNGVPQITVTFDIDTDGIINVSAKDWDGISVKEEGEFKDGRLVKGTKTWPDGTKEEGKFKDGRLVKGTKTRPEDT